LSHRGKILKKICLLGDFAVGKTSLIRRFVLDEFDDRYITTVGTKITKKEVEVDNDTVVMQIWDIIGNVMYSRLQKQYYKGADGAFIVCDVTREETMESLKHWAIRFRDIMPKAVVIFIANKKDLKSKYDVENGLKTVADDFNAKTFITSAKTGDNVEKAFGTLAKTIR
jgi:small GTP-binding protein